MGKRAAGGKRQPELSYRAVSLATARGTAPVSLSRKARSVEFTAATENPVPMWDWEHGTIDEVLLMQGCRLPDSGQVPLLDTHSRFSTSDVIGSGRDLRTEDGELVARAVFSSTPLAEEVFTKIEEGHITDVSIGYRVHDSTVVPEGEKAIIAGRSWTGPKKVVTSWSARELSVCPIGADEAAKARAAGHAVSVSISQRDGSQPPNNDEGDEGMNEALRKLLEARGLARDASEEQAWEFYLHLSIPEKREVAKKAVADLSEEDGGDKSALERIEEMRRNKIREDALTVERERARIREIDAICVELDVDDRLRVELIEKGTPLESAKSQILKWAAQNRGSRDGSAVRPVVVTAEEREKTRDAAIEGLSFRSGMRLGQDFDPQGHPYVASTMVEMAKDRLRAHGRPVPTMPDEVVKRAMTDSDLPYILAATTNKFLYRGWDEQPSTYQVWCDEGQLPNYKSATFPRPSAFPDLLEVNPADGEYVYGSFGDQVETTALKHWGRLLGVSIQSMVDDDLGVFSDTASRMGAAARRTVDKYVYQTVLTSNSGTGEAMGDTNNLFDATNHSNYVASGSGGAVSITTLDTLAQYMENQTDGDGTSYVGEQPMFILANSYYRFAITNILVSTNPAQLGDSSTPVFNPWASITPVFSPHITTNTKKWWAIAGPRGKTVRVFGLNGPPRPVVEDRAEFHTAGWTFRVTMDYIAKALDWRYLAANYGS